MNKLFIPIVILLFGLLSGCGFGSDYEIKMAKPLYFNSEKDMPLEINVTEAGKAVKGLKVTAKLTMVTMDHGTNRVNLVEGKAGTYAGKVKLGMGGKYEIAFSLEKDGQKIEKVIDYVVKKPAGIASINGQWIKSEELAFTAFLNKLQLAMSRESAQKTYRGKQLDDELAYINAQEKMIDNKNQLLTQIIRLRSMSILGTEKGHHVTREEIAAKMNLLHQQYDPSTAANKLIQQYGKAHFWQNEKKNVPMMLLSDKVANDLIDKTKAENPNTSLQEIHFLAQQKFEDLLV
ncbi:MAG: FixH family protein, partial [Bacillota bacterium]|nr:FixH family protein [Bacillota bacterium]